MDSQTCALLTAMGGAIGSPQLRRLGIDSDTVTRWVRLGLLRRVRRGAFVDPRVWDAADLDGRYRLTVMAVMRSRETEEPATHHSALALHGLPLWHVPRSLTMLFGDVCESVTHSGLRITPLRAHTNRTEVDGLPVLAVADAIVTTASVNVEAGVVAADAALHEEQCTQDDLDEAHERLRRGLRGTARLRRTIALVDPAAESPGESRLRLILDALGVPFETQRRILDGKRFVARVDFLVAGKVVVEFDGLLKYRGEDGEEAVIAEKLREDRIRALGYAVVRVTWAELAEPHLIRARLLAAVEQLAA
jgi:very-short-patch-repair endonuclease